MIWNASAESVVNSYSIVYKRLCGNSSAETISGIMDTSITLYNLSAGLEYHIIVFSVNNIGNGTELTITVPLEPKGTCMCTVFLQTYLYIGL